MGLAKFALRTTVGGIIMGHGLQKLKGSFGGSGLEGTAKMMESLGLHPPKYQAWAVALSETVGGGLTAAGFLSPLGPSMIIGSQAVAINKVHLKNGFWSHKGGYEYNLTLIAAAFALAELGPGSFSLDRLFGKRRSGFGWALASAAVALSAAAACLQLAEKLAPKEATEAGAGGPAASTAGAGGSAASTAGAGGPAASTAGANGGAAGSSAPGATSGDAGRTATGTSGPAATGSSTAGGSTAGGSTAGGSTAGGSTAGGSTAGGSTAGGTATKAEGTAGGASTESGGGATS